MKRKRRFVWTLAMVFLMAIGIVSADTLWAGQNMDVGDLNVWDDGNYIYVEYMTTDGWELVETHLAVESTLEAIPQTKTGNPKPGNFAYQMAHDPPTTGYTYQVGFIDPAYIAAHAVVQKTTIEQPAPYGAGYVVDYMQGLKKDGSPVRAARSDPANALEFEAGQSESNFFSLGFGGYIIIGYDYPIMNGDGNDIKVVEDTWGSYPLEAAEVYASEDGISWTLLGTADNTQHEGIHTVSEFDLGDMDEAMFIKVVDVSDPEDFSRIPSADGYDVNAVLALQDYTTTQTETAWAEGSQFPGRNWATFFMYEAVLP